MFNAENTDKVCQCCLKNATHDDNLRPISDFVNIGRDPTKIQQLFRSFSDDCGIFQEFPRSSYICNGCLEQLIATTSFYQKCVQSKTLIQMKQDLDLEQEKMQSRDYVPGDFEPVLIRIPTPPVIYIDDDEEIVERRAKSPIKFPENEKAPVQKIRVIVPYRFECLKCESTHKTQTDFLIHLSEIHEATCIFCDTCSAVFNNQVENNAHQLKHFIRNHTRFSCEECAQQFPSPQALKIHSLLHRDEILCRICMKQCDDYTTLNSHLLQHADQRVLPCIYCDLKFRTATCLNDHISEIHNSRRIRCLECPERFASKDELRMHQNDVHEVPRETYDCKVCKKVFAEKKDLTNHLTSHLNNMNGNHFIPVHTTTAPRVHNQRYHHNRAQQMQRMNNNNNHNQQQNYNNNQQGKAKKQVKRLVGNVYSRLG